MSSETKSRAELVEEWRKRPIVWHSHARYRFAGNLSGLVEAVRLAVNGCADELEALESSSSADTGGREAERYGGAAVLRVCSKCSTPYPEYSMSSHIICWNCRRGADTGTTGAEGLAAYDALLAVMGELDRLKIADAPMSDWLTLGTMSLVESALTSRNDIGNTPAAQRDMDSLAQQAEAAATQRAAVTPPTEQLGLCDRHRWLHPKDQGPSLPPFQFPCENWAAPAPVTTSGRDVTALALEFLEKCSRVIGPLGAIPAPTTAEIEQLIETSRNDALAAAKEPRG